MHLFIARVWIKNQRLQETYSLEDYREFSWDEITQASYKTSYFLG